MEEDDLGPTEEVDLAVGLGDRAIGRDDDAAVEDPFAAGLLGRVVLGRLGQVVDARDERDLELFRQRLQAELVRKARQRSVKADERQRDGSGGLTA